ncbi:CapA family protein [Sphingobium sp. EM0848]|uniref:CapA family protein n=1 Tax=Sphingobium sp. EM0848 TaxID=2743473 RepID=UPI00159C3C47|nr:CapA family protein [Sphingobium sp. EM0848]
MIRLAAVGDVAAFHREPELAWAHAGPVLEQYDVVFAQNERLYSNTIALPDVGFTELTCPEHAAALQLGHLDVVSFASNHCYDLGPDVFLETVEALRSQGFAVIGAGKDIEEARAPAILERGGLRIGFLAYSSVLRKGYEARPNKPGAAPMRAHTLYEQVDYQPGTAPRIRTFADRDDLTALLVDIAAARKQTDFLAVSLHWGVHLVKGVIADYEKEVARAVIDAGADMIIGHGPHLLKAVEVYRGKPIFYSISGFCIDSPREIIEAGMARNAEFRELIEAHQETVAATEYDEWFMAYAMNPEMALSVIASVELAPDASIQRILCRPVVINTRAQPVPQSAGDPGFQRVLEYLREVTAHQKISTQYTVDGDYLSIPIS